MSRYVDPHLDLEIHGLAAVSTQGPPPEVARQQHLRASYDLGLYTVEELTDLLEELGATVTEWVGVHPPYEAE